MKKNTVEVVLQGCSITIRVAGKMFFANYTVDIEDEQKYLFDLMVWILFYDCGENRRNKYIDLPIAGLPEIENDNDKTLLCYSGGVDSTAIKVLFPDCIPVNLYRSYDPDFNLSQMRILHNTRTMMVETDLELMREIYFPDDRGYNMGDGYIGLMFPLVNILKIKYITFGAIFDDMAFWYGDPFKFNSSSSEGRTDYIRLILSRLGINLVYLLAGVSEILSTRIVNDSAYKNLACSCHHRIYEPNFCGHCYKCFRKLGTLGQQLDFKDKKIKEFIIHYLKQRPLKMAASTVYGIQKARYNLPEFERYMGVDVSFCDRYNDNLTKQYNTPESYKMMVAKFKEIGIQKQTSKDLENINKFVEFIRNPKLYEF